LLLTTTPALDAYFKKSYIWHFSTVLTIKHSTVKFSGSHHSEWINIIMTTLAEDIASLMALGHNLERATELAQADRARGNRLLSPSVPLTIFLTMSHFNILSLGFLAMDLFCPR
jgi:hypothetical protein